MAELSEAVTEGIVAAADGMASEAGTVAEAAHGLTPGHTRAYLIGFGVGLVTGGAAAWFIANRRMQTKADLIVAEEITKMREHYRAKEQARTEQKKPDLKEVVEEAGYATPATPPPSKVIGHPATTKNIFEEPPKVPPEVARVTATKDPAAGWDYDAEIRSRDGRTVYIIHENEVGEKPYNTEVLTWFEGDDVLADSSDKIVENRDSVIGDALEHFGHGSSDPHTVFVRNDDLAADLEISRAPGTYAETVHGFRHSDEAFERRRRLNRDDE